MHANVQTRYNPAVGERAPYYRLKESFSDVRGRVHSLIILNIGFEPSLDGLTPEEQQKADEWWSRMIAEGRIDRFKEKEALSRREAEHYIDLDTAKHTEAKNVGAEWLCKQMMDRLQLERFLEEKGVPRSTSCTAWGAVVRSKDTVTTPS